MIRSFSYFTTTPGFPEGKEVNMTMRLGPVDLVGQDPHEPVRHRGLSSFQLGSKMVGRDYPTYFIADIGANPDGELERALMLIRKCAEAGADAAKFQNFRAETIVSAEGFAALESDSSHQASWKDKVVDVYRRSALPMEWTEQLHAECERVGIDYLTTPYDIDLLAELDPHVQAWKIGSGDITWTELIAAVAAGGKPILLATGAASMEDVRRAVAVVRASRSQMVLMQCNTNYTGSHDNFNHIALNVLTSFGEEFPDCVLGLSDHTPGHATTLGAVALGARVIEKHFTDDRNRPGPDHHFALDPAGWLDMVERTRELEQALGPNVKRVMDNEQATVVVQRRALRARSPLPAGKVLAAHDLIALRPCPAEGLPPYRRDQVLGRTLLTSLDKGDLVRMEDLDS